MEWSPVLGEREVEAILGDDLGMQGAANYQVILTTALSPGESWGQGS